MVKDKKIIWVPSYPKSGNTWVRMILLYLIWGNDTDPRKLNVLLPEITNRSLMREFSRLNVVFSKTHYSYGRKLPNKDHTLGFIYVVRHPFDVMISNMNYHILKEGSENLAHINVTDPNDPDFKKLKINFLYDFIKNKGLKYWIEYGFGNLNDHVESWLAQADNMPNLFVRFEDLKDKPHAELKRISLFLGRSIDDNVIDDIIAKTSFSVMRKLEEKEIDTGSQKVFYEHAGHKDGLRFMNKGKTDQWKSVLDDEFISEARSAFLPILEQFGYNG